MLNQISQLVLRLAAFLLVEVVPVEIVNLSDSAHQIYQSVELPYLKTLDNSLRSVLESLFKFDCFKLERNFALIKLFLVSGLFVLNALLEDLVQIVFTAALSLLLCTDQLTEVLSHFNWT